jgi:phage baseplate assembly protein W
MADNRQLLTDIRLALRDQRFRPVYTVDEEQRRVPTQAGLSVDMSTTSGHDNLGQAILLRLLTPRGELAQLAHPEYGSRLHELIGRVNNETTRNLVKLFILESLQLEPRIAEIVEVTVTPVEGSRTREDVRHLVNVLLQVRPIAETTVVTIGPFVLELG